MDTDYPGDPLTPGVARPPTPSASPIKDAKTITKIPVLPISYADALPLLSALTGPVAPESWRGALAITYHIGPGPAQVHLKVASNWDIKPLYDVIATLPGSDGGRQWVLRGNHHDAWVNGADDPISGQAAMLEEARMLGELHRQGWTPKRTIIYCAWDGEEPGLLGSVEWVEAHVDELKQHAVAYINSDSNERGFLFPGGTQDLQTFISGVARDVQDPETHMSVFQRAHLAGIAQAKDAEERNDLRKRSDLVVHALGDGSDYTAFQDFAGISTLSVEFGDEDDGTQYHSIYDDFYWYTHFVDTDFSYGRALAQTAGTRDDAPGRRGPDSRGLLASSRGHREVRKRAGEVAQRQAGRIHRAQSGIAGRCVHGDGRSAPAHAAASGRDRSALHEFFAHEECH